MYYCVFVAITLAYEIFICVQSRKMWDSHRKVFLKDSQEILSRFKESLLTYFLENDILSRDRRLIFLLLFKFNI